MQLQIFPVNNLQIQPFLQLILTMDNINSIGNLQGGNDAP